MEVAEIPIGPEQRSKKKFSSGVQKRTNTYLSEKGIHLEQLTDEQQQCVFKYIKAKKAVRCWVLVGGLSVVVFGVLSLYWWSLINHFSDVFMPDTTVIVLDDGTEKVVELDRELIGGYGKLCSIFGGVLVTVLYSAISAFVGLFSSVANIRSTKKILDAFLPTVSSVTSTQPKNNTGFDNTQ